MSVNMTHYLGIGYYLDYDTYNSTVEDFETANPNYDQWHADHGPMIITDGMNGNYIYILYVFKTTDMEEMWYNCDPTVDMSKLDEAGRQAAELYKKVTGQEPADVPKIINLFHCS